MIKEFFEKVAQVKNGVVSQPDAYTCQSACIEMALGSGNVYQYREQLLDIGTPGDPYAMGQILDQLGNRYIFDENACLSEIRDWLKQGEFLITHGWFTGSGHVIGLDGVAIDQTNMSYKLSVKDPWSEFDARSWSYPYQSKSYDGYYSSYLIYAACVAGQSRVDSRNLYRKGVLDSMHKGAWVHRVLP